ncbi:hypothetical protein APSETT444_006410 [Aspergillus pseudonomiae]
MEEMRRATLTLRFILVYESQTRDLATPKISFGGVAEEVALRKMPKRTDFVYSDMIQFPDLLLVMRQLIDFIFSEKKLQLDFERGIYRSVITAMGGSEAFANLVHNTVDPDVRALKGQIITAEV